MAKKARIVINRSEQLSVFDSELDAAMERLDETNVRIDEVLSSFDPPEESGESEDAFDEESDGDGDLEAGADEDEAADEDEEDAGDASE